MRHVALLLVIALIAAGGWLGWQQYELLQQPFQGWSGAEQFVDIDPGTGTRAIGQRLIDGGVVADALTWRVALWRRADATRLEAGEYRFDRPMRVDEVIGRLVRGDVYLRSITIPEGLTIRQMARAFADARFGPARDFEQAAGDVSLVSDSDPSARDLEGYLFPDTYALPRRAAADDLVRLMMARFKTVFGDDLQRAAAARGLTVRQAVTIASLVEKETARPDERPVVAAVYHNRMAKRMGLQCDPTVIYALERANRYTGNLTKADLTFDSPYNTYRYAGLPPGPIASPGRSALEAAVRPAPVNYLYFVSRNDGSHAFAATLSEHNKNVFTYQVQYFRGQRTRPRAAPAGHGR